MTIDQIVPGAHVVEVVTSWEYQIDKIDTVTDLVYIYNWLLERTVPVHKFIDRFELAQPLSFGEQNKLFALDEDLCNHEFVEYNGLRESFKFCKKCDKKQ